MERNFAKEIYSESLRSSSLIDSNGASAARSGPDDVDVAWEDEESWNESDRLDGEGRARGPQLYNLLCVSCGYISCFSLLDWLICYCLNSQIGYHDGVITGKEASSQEGFNAGVKQSMGSGYKWGVVRGVASVLHCLPNALKAKLVERDESGVKFVSLYQSVHPLSTSDVLKLCADEIVGEKTTPVISSVEVHSSSGGLSVTSSQSTVLTNYFCRTEISSCSVSWN